MELREKDKQFLNSYKFKLNNISYQYVEACILLNGYYELENYDYYYKLREELFSHPDLNLVPLKPYCENLKRVNKYKHYQFQIYSCEKNLWDYKEKDCLVYCEQNDKGILVSIRREQFFNFVSMLDELNIEYNLEELKDFLFVNNSVDKVEICSLDYLSFKPFDYQLKDIDKLLGMKRALIGHEMGCGKTFIAGVLGESLPGMKLVICPESLRINWEREILNINPNTKISIKQNKDNFDDLECDWLIIGYHTASTHFKKLNPHVLFIDEAHFIKATNNWGQPTSARAKAVLDIAERADRVYGLTGTPIPSRNLDAFNLLKLVKNENFDFNTNSGFYKFVNRYCDPKENRWGKDYSGNSNSTELHKILSQSMIRRLKKDVLSHLKKQRQFIPIKPKLTKEYLEVEDKLYDKDENYLGLAMTGRKLLANTKIKTAQELAEIILNNGEQVVIVTNFIESADRLKEIFKKDACEIRGGQSDKQKQKAIDDFQAGKKRVCILNMVAGGVGITLTKAKYLIMVDYDWTPANNIQVEDRICRTGQTELCTIYYIYCENSIFDRVFVRMLSEKSYNISKAVDNEENQFNLTKEKKENSTYLDFLKREIRKKK